MFWRVFGGLHCQPCQREAFGLAETSLGSRIAARVLFSCALLLDVLFLHPEYVKD